MPQKRKYRLYSAKYLAYGFIESLTNKSLPMCLMCHKSFSNEAMKPSRLQQHLRTRHKDKIDKPVEYFQDLQEQLMKQTSEIENYTDKKNTISSELENYMEKQTTVSSALIQKHKNKDGLVASYKISELIAKNGGPNIIGEKLLKPCFEVLISTMMHQDPAPILKSIAISDTTISRRIDEMALDIEKQLTSILQTRSFSMQVVQSSIMENKTLVMVCVCYFDQKNVQQEEMLFTNTFTMDKENASIFSAIKSYFIKHNIPFTNVLGCAIDGASTQVDFYKTFLEHLKNEVPEILLVHNMIHLQNLITKITNPNLYLSLTILINTINKIKSNAKNNPVFQKLCKDYDETYMRLLLQTDVLWLSKSQCFPHFAELYGTVFQFFESTERNDICHTLKTIKNDIFYFADIFTKLNEFNLQLQRKNMNLIEYKQVICLFLEKLNLLRQNIINQEVHQFSKLFSIKDDLISGDFEKYSTHIDALKTEMETCFKNIIKLKVEVWMENPFTINIFEVENTYQEEILKLRTDIESNVNFNEGGYKQLWQNEKIPVEYPHLWNKIYPLLMSFPTSHLVEKGLNIMKKIISKERKHMDVGKRGDFRLFLSRIKPNIDDLISRHQQQCSH